MKYYFLDHKAWFPLYKTLWEKLWHLFYSKNHNSLICNLSLMKFHFYLSSFFSYVYLQSYCHIQVHPSRNNIPAVEPPPNHTSLPSTAATFLVTRLMAVLQPSRYSVFHGGDTPIQLSLPWRSYSCQCLNTETSTWGNRGFPTETPSISYTFRLYIRLVVTL